MAFGCGDNTVRAINASNGKQVLFMGGHNDWVFDTAFSTKGDYLVSVGRDMTSKLTKVDTERLIDNITSITPKALKGGIAAVVGHPLRDEIIVGGSDGTPKMYQMHRTTARRIGDDANLLLEFPEMTGRVFSVDISTDAKRVAAASSLDGKGWVAIHEIDPKLAPEKAIKDILVRPTHERNGDQIKKMREYFENSVKTLATIALPNSSAYAVAFNPEGSHLAAAGTDGTVRIYDAADGSEVTVVLFPSKSKTLLPPSNHPFQATFLDMKLPNLLTTLASFVLLANLANADPDAQVETLPARRADSGIEDSARGDIPFESFRLCAAVGNRAAFVR